MDSSLRDSQEPKSSAPARARKPSKGSAKLTGDPPPTLELLVVSVPTSSTNVKIQVSSTMIGGSQYPLFYLPGNPTKKFKDGVALIFQSPQKTSTIYWYLDSSVSELTSESPLLTFSSVSGGEQTVTTQAHTYSAQSIPFLVSFNSGKMHDPQIIITPIGGTKMASPRLPVVKRGAKGKAASKVPSKAKAGKAKASKAKGGKPAKAKRKKR